MNQITVEKAVGEKLAALTGQAVLCDSEGRALGFFSPIGEQLKVEDLQLEPPLSIAETEELRKVRTGKPLEEILRSRGVQ
jgi:hypothetical protein